MAGAGEGRTIPITGCIEVKIAELGGRVDELSGGFGVEPNTQGEFKYVSYRILLGVTDHVGC